MKIASMTQTMKLSWRAILTLYKFSSLSLNKIPLKEPLQRSRVKMILDWINKCLSEWQIWRKYEYKKHSKKSPLTWANSEPNNDKLSPQHPA